jgi:FAD/FMN-containing dehydrogenase
MSANTSSTNVKTLDDSSVELTRQTLDGLQARLQGELLTTGDTGYDESRTIWNGMIDRSPGLVARCLGVADVVATVNFAREHALLLSIRGGGHNISGLALCDGGMTIDMSGMRGVWVDTNADIARVQGGCILGDVDRETQLHGRAAVIGFVSKTGVTGLTLGGGFGYLSRKYGWTSDNVVSMELVTAEGKLVRASEKENSDLFWALRGGGGNFGVVTSTEHKLYSVGPEVMAGAIAWRADDAREVLEMYGALMAQAPPEFNCAAVLRPAPPAPWLPEDVHGKLIVALFVIHAGSVEEGKKAVASIKAFGSPVGDIIQPRPYLTQQSILDATQPNGRRYYWKSEYMPGFQPGLFDKFIEHAERIVSSHSAVILFPLDGALNKLPQDHSAVGNRDAKLVLNITASWETPDDDQANIDWARSAWADMRSFSTGGTYINFLTEEEVGGRIQDAYGENYNRLVEAKTKWDPDNFFRMNKNIAPKG